MKNENSKLAGKKCFLRYPTIEDCAEFTANVRQSANFHRNLVSPPKNKADFESFLTRNESDVNESFLICRKSDAAIMGAVNLSQIFRRIFQNCYLGYYLFEKFTGKGLMSEAVALVLRHAFLNLKLHRVEANVQPENTPSIAVLLRNGFTKEGFSRKYLKVGGKWRDHERFAIIKEDWREKR